MKLTPAMAIVLSVGFVCLTFLVWHGDVKGDVLTHALAVLLGAFAPGSVQQIKRSLYPPPYSSGHDHD
jgi:hypothetical protein